MNELTQSNKKNAAEIITVGTELLLGHIIDTNSAYIGVKLAEIGINLYYKTSVGDNDERLQEALRIALKRANIIIITGGLGPTVDDITKGSVVKLLNKQLILNEKILSKIKGFFEARKIKMPQNNVSQALLPAGSTAIDNPNGTAPGIIAATDDGRYLILLPGVPREMKEMMTASVIPFLSEKFPSQGVIKSRTLKVFGLGESTVDEKINELFRLSENPTIALLASHLEVKIRLTAKAKDNTEADALIEKLEHEIRSRLEDNIFASDDETMEKNIGILLLMKRWTISAAESCTGGLISDKLTDVPGSSAYFKDSIISYSNESKISILKVPEEALHTFGAVSKQVAEEMALAVRKLSKTDIGLSITGICGPDGGTPEKPVGLIFVGIATETEVFVKEFRFSGEREKIKEQAAQAALDTLRRYLLKVK